MTYLQKCTEFECPYFGKPVAYRCGCTVSELDYLRTRNAELTEALEECAASFCVATREGVRWEEIAREFNRRQNVAADALTDPIYDESGFQIGRASPRKDSPS